jgi:hypothetical protein
MLVAALVALVGGSTAFAGRKTPATVFIEAAQFQAWGALGSARNATDTNQQIGCQVEAQQGQTPMVYCLASDSSGQSAHCASSDPAMVQIALSLSSDSYVHFTWNGGTCRELLTWKDSSLDPKLP